LGFRPLRRDDRTPDPEIGWCRNKSASEFRESVKFRSGPRRLDTRLEWSYGHPFTALIHPGRRVPLGSHGMCGSNFSSRDDRKLLLRLARRTARIALTGHGDVEPIPCLAGVFGGAFVTFWNAGRLRGCVGRFVRTEDIAGTVVEVTKLALVDRRFCKEPIIADELARLVIEVSLLSDIVPTDDPLSLVPGQHGIVIQHGKRTGCFLPRVAVERGWQAEEFLRQCCTMKAGLPGDSWQDRQRTRVFLFTAEDFREDQ